MFAIRWQFLRLYFFILRHCRYADTLLVHGDRVPSVDMVMFFFVVMATEQVVVL